MKEKKILCCLNDYPLFSYVPIEEEDAQEQYIINYVTKSEKDIWYRKEIVEEKNFKIIYVEVDLKKALKKIKNHSYKRKEKMYVFVLEFFLQEYPRKISQILNNTKDFTQEEIKDLYNIGNTLYKEKGKKSKNDKI